MTSALFQVRNRQLLLLDTLCFLLTPTLALALRLDFIPWGPGRSILNDHLQSLLIVTVVFFALKLAAFYGVGLYRRYWRYAGIDELILISVAGLLLLISQSAVFFLVLQPAGLIPLFPRSIPILDVLVALFVFSSIRFIIPVAERIQQRLHNHHHSMRVLVAGAGSTGRLVVNEMQNTPKLRLYPVAFVDDDPQKQGVYISGVKVRGNIRQIPRLAQQMRAQKVIIAMPNVPGENIRKIVSICEEAGIQCQYLPGMQELLKGRHSSTFPD